ncbi:MAG: DUF1684 domain-containing protein [Bacteroidales bacterium]|nr:DUF1684 domain-containing protein [Bacteroidales bacterium]
MIYMTIKSVKYIMVHLTILSGFLWLGACSNTDTDSAYRQQVRDYRKIKNQEFLNTEKTPLTSDQVNEFEGLKYFEVDSSFRIKAVLQPFEKQDTFKMATTTEREPEYIRYAKAKFSLKGKQHTLEVYRNVQLLNKPEYSDYIFIPFTDKTSGNESYGGGRYLDLQLPRNDSLLIDFNYAYNPYCAYNSGYSCPVPPRVNHLDVAIEAGEKAFHH